MGILYLDCGYCGYYGHTRFSLVVSGGCVRAGQQFGPRQGRCASDSGSSRLVRRQQVPIRITPSAWTTDDEVVAGTRRHRGRVARVDRCSSNQ